MCEHGTETPIEVTIPAHLSHTGEARQKVVGVDSCIAPVVRALNAAGVVTISSCCGHGHLPATIAVEGDLWWVRVTREQREAFEAAFPTDIHGERMDPVSAALPAGRGSEVSEEGDNA